jgi:hypothetical protein
VVGPKAVMRFAQRVLRQQSSSYELGPGSLGDFLSMSRRRGLHQSRRGSDARGQPRVRSYNRPSGAVGHPAGAGGHLLLIGDGTMDEVAAAVKAGAAVMRRIPSELHTRYRA